MQNSHHVQIMNVSHFPSACQFLSDLRHPYMHLYNIIIYDGHEPKSLYNKKHVYVIEEPVVIFKNKSFLIVIWEHIFKNKRFELWIRSNFQLYSSFLSCIYNYTGITYFILNIHCLYSCHKCQNIQVLYNYFV